MYRLTQRELDVSKLVLEGLTNKEIGERLYISAHTVKTNLESIFVKLDVKNRIQLAVYVVRYEYKKNKIV